MKKLHVIMLTLLMLLVGVVSISAKEKEKFTPLPCVLTLNDGSKVSGYLVNFKKARVMASVYGQNIYNIQTLFISPTPTGKETNYEADDAKELELT